MAFTLWEIFSNPDEMNSAAIFKVHSNLRETYSIPIASGTNSLGVSPGLRFFSGFFCEKEIFGFITRLMTDNRFFITFKKEIQA